MPATGANLSSGSKKRKPNAQAASTRGKSESGATSALAAQVAQAPPEQSDGPSSDESEDDDGVDEVGMKRLMNALGDDGIGEYEMAQLELLAGDEESDGGVGDSDGSENQLEGSEVESGDEDEDEDEAESVEDEGTSSQEGGAEPEQEEVEDAISLDGIDDALDEDTVPIQKLKLQDDAALERIHETIKLDPLLPWTETLTILYPEPIVVDVEDDLNRELSFYKQALHATEAARKLAAKHNLPFTRPPDFFAEMVKSDAHMERIRQRLLDESATIKRSEQKRKEREGKKFGKQVQLEKAKERERNKKDMDERLKGLKRKRKGALDNAEADDNAFDVAVEDALTDRPAKRGKVSGGAKLPRHARDKKFGFGGAGRRSKQNTKASTDDVDGPSRRARGSARGARGGRGHATKRLGKSRRAAAK